MAHLIDTQPALADALEEIGAQSAIALDTETDAFFAYRPRICLLQVSFPGRDLILDPLASLDLAGFGELLADPDRTVVLHAAENDVIMLKHEFGWCLGTLYDTQIACFVLGLPPYSLAGVLETRFDVKLDKSQQRSDWSRRPLAPEQLRYAADDTHYLLELAADLQERARTTGRTEEIASECRRVAEREWEPEPFDPEGFRRIAGARELDGAALRVLRDLYLFRNREAERRNRAPYRVAPDSALTTLAREGARPGRGVPKAFWQRYQRDLHRIVEAARRRGPLPPRRARRRGNGGPTPPAVKQRYERLRRWRTRTAEERGVEPFVVARNDLLMRVAQAECADLAELAGIVEPFRLREYGEAMLHAMRDE